MAVMRPAGGWTYDDLFKLPDNGRQHEIIYGELYEMPPPSLAHQEIVIRLILLLAGAVERIAAELLCAPIGVFMPDTEPVQPDLLVLTRDRLHLKSERGIEGAPALVVEVLSPSTRKHDRVTKRLLYAHGGVREYWLVDPATATIEVLALVGDAYGVHVRAHDDQPVTSTVLPELSFPASAAFAR
jgi:Uma2 family endonuclease